MFVCLDLDHSRSNQCRQVTVDRRSLRAAAARQFIGPRPRLVRDRHTHIVQFHHTWRCTHRNGKPLRHLWLIPGQLTQRTYSAYYSSLHPSPRIWMQRSYSSGATFPINYDGLSYLISMYQPHFPAITRDSHRITAQTFAGFRNIEVDMRTVGPTNAPRITEC